nr:efflux RND transporter permease subunit [Desulfovibrio sp.]
IFRSPGANIIETVDRIKDMLPQLASWLPESADLRLRMDRSITIRASLKEVEKSLILAIALVVLVTFLFLRNIRATAIPAVAAPVSLIATFGVMYLCDYSLDNLSLMALTVSTGFVVDDAIVVLENIVRRIELGDSPLQAALKGGREVGFTVISISISLVAVFMPIIFMGGVVGLLFQEFAIVLSASVLISMLVSLTTTPMMCAQLLRPYSVQISKRKKYLRELKKGRLKPLVRFFFASNLFLDRMVNGMRDAYSSSLKVTLNHPRLTLLSLFLIIALNVWLYIYIPKGFFPQQDTGVIMGGIRADQSASYQSLTDKIERLVNLIKSDPAVSEVSAHISGARAGGGVFIALKPLEERKISAQGVVARLRGKLVSEPGLQIFLHPAQDIMMGGRSSRSGYQYTLQADDLDSLREWGRKLQDALSQDPLFKDVNSDIEERGLQTMLNLDRDAMARLGVTMAEVDSALNNAFGQRQISTIYQDKNQYRVVLEYDQDWLNDAQSLEKVYVKGRSGLVPLLSFATVGPGFAPLSVSHQGQFAAVTISFNLDPGVSLSQAQTAIDRIRVKLGMPSTIVGSFQGTAKMFTDTLNNQILLIVAALIALYITLGILYESLIHPITILSTLPSAGVGALLALLLFHMEFSVIALIGVLLLAGIVKKNAIMLIDFAIHAQRSKHTDTVEAIYEACLLRFRPIIMTTAAAVMGAIPLAIGQGDGAEIRQPLGIAIVGGLLVSQALTLYTTPVVYIYLDRWRERAGRRIKRWRKGEKAVGIPEAPRA